MTEIRETYFQYLERVAPDEYRPSIALAEMVADAMFLASQEVFSRLPEDHQMKMSAVLAIAMGALQSGFANAADSLGDGRDVFLSSMRDAYDSRQTWTGR